MEDVLFINETFFKKNISHKQSFNTTQVLSTIRLVQKTNLESIISSPVYSHFQTLLSGDDEFTEGESKLFESMQLYLAVKSAEELIYSAPRKDDEDKPLASLTYRGKSTLLEARIVRDINRDEDLLTLAQSGTEDFLDGEMDNAGGFYFES